jgi:hypothetical protein
MSPLLSKAPLRNKKLFKKRLERPFKKKIEIRKLELKVSGKPKPQNQEPRPCPLPGLTNRLK